MFNTAKKLIAKNYEVAYVSSTKIPKTFTCPDCLARVKQLTDNPVLQKRASKNVVVGIKTNKKSVKHMAMCSKCAFTKTK